MKKLYSYNQFINEDLQSSQSDVNTAQGQLVAPQGQLVAPQGQIQPQSQPVKDKEQVQKEPNQEFELNTGATDYKAPINTKLSKFTSMIDYTCLKPGATKDDINKLIQEAVDNYFYAVCVPYEFVDHTAYTIDEGKIKVVSVVDFPEGKSKESDKLFETIELISNGADELNMVMDWEALKGAYEEEDGEDQESSYYHIEDEIRTIAQECHKNGIILKVIIESGELTIEQVTKACQLVANANADYIMTSTGTKSKPVDLDTVREIRRVIPEHMKICVSGGIRTLDQMEQFYQYCDRFATSVIPK
jgi:deoxyribose-phosphate aldolase